MINGTSRAGSGEALRSLDPATGDTVWSGAAASAQDVEEAVVAARAAFPTWAATPFEERRELVVRFQSVLEARRDAIAETMSRETGKPLWETLGEVGAMMGKVDISLTAYGERTGEKALDTAFGAARLSHRPHGVMAVLGPYNFPGHLPNGHIVPALIAGDTVVFKPSELTPATGAAMAEAWAEAGAPAGVINVVQGARDTGAALLDAAVDGVLFTGSVDTGLVIHRKFAGRPDVILALEMGGNNPLVVWDASDTDAAAILALQSAFITSGQRCSCARRLVLPEGGAGDAVLDRLIALIDRVRVGAWNDAEEPFMGPLVSEGAADRVREAQTRLSEKGARVLKPLGDMARGPAFLTPGVVDASGLDLPDAETFGPLLTVYREPSFEAALARANATNFGLSAGLVSDDRNLWDAFSAQVRAGIVNWNRPTTGAMSSMPFGGPGFSGNHRPSAYYAADYCAYPVASQEAETLERLATKGLADA